MNNDIMSISTTVKMSYREGSTFSDFLPMFHLEIKPHDCFKLEKKKKKTTDKHTTDIEGIFPVKYVTPKICVITNLSNQTSQSTWILSLCLCLHLKRDPGIKMFFSYR